MTDIHSHLLPNVDDGSSSLDMSRRILAQYVQQKIGDVICTPHQNKEIKRAEALKESFAAFREAVSDIPVNLYLGAEIYYYGDMLRDLQRGELLTMNGTRYVLVEFSTRQPTEIADVVHDLKVAGYIPIVAHIERYSYLTWDDYFTIKENGGLIQINSRIFRHRHQKKIGKFLCKNDLVDFIASDCHDDVERKVELDKICRYVCAKYRKLSKRLLTENENTEKILQNR